MLTSNEQGSHNSDMMHFILFVGIGKFLKIVKLKLPETVPKQMFAIFAIIDIFLEMLLLVVA